MNTDLNVKKVLFVAPSAYPLGGVQTWLDYIVSGLARPSNDQEQRFSTSIALTSGAHHDADRYLRVHPFDNVHIVENPTGLIEGRTRVIENLLRTVNPDIVLVVNIVDVYRAVNNLRAQGNRQIRVVTTLHGIHPGIIDDISFYHNCIDAVLTTNKLTSKLVIEKTPIDVSNVLYAPYGVAILDPDQAQKRASTQFTVSYVGRIEEDQKRISDLLLIFEELLLKEPNTKVLIAGDGPEADMAKLNAWLDKQSNPNIHYLGVLNPKQLAETVYHTCDVMLLTSHWETGPIVAWEAFQHGITLVSSKYIGSKEEGSLIHRKNCLMFDIGDNRKAVDLLIQSQSKDLRQQLTASAATLLKDRYSTDISINTWAQELQKVAAKPAKPYHKIQRSKADKSRLLGVLKTVLGGKAYRVYEHLHLILQRKFKHHSAGSEWPHSASAVDSRSQQLTQYISNTD